MKKTATLLSVLGLAAVLAGPAFAATLMTEDFSYSNGNLAIAPSVSGGNWLSHSGTSGTDIQCTGGMAVGSMAQAYDDNHPFLPAQGATAKTYACFRVLIPGGPGSTPRTNFFAHFSDGGTSTFTARVFVAPMGTSFSFGLSTFSATMNVQWPTALNYDQWYNLMLKYDAAAGTAELWVDPLSEASAKISAAASTGSAGNTVSSFALRQSTGGTGNAWSFNVDDIAVGTTFESICPAPTPVNGSTWGRLKVLYR